MLLLGLAVPSSGAQTACPAGTGGSPATGGTLALSTLSVAVPATVNASGGGFSIPSDVQFSLVKQGTTVSTPAGSGIALVNGDLSEAVTIAGSTSPGAYNLWAVGTGQNNECRKLESPTLLVSKVLGLSFGRLTLGAATRKAGEATTATGQNCSPKAAVTFGFDTKDNLIGTTTSDAQGGFSGTAHIPARTGAGQHAIFASCTGQTGVPLLLNAPINVGAAATLKATLVRPVVLVVVVGLLGIALLMGAWRWIRARSGY